MIGVFEMVVMIVAIVTIGRIYAAKNGVCRRGGDREIDHAAATENARLKSEISQLKERIATLERIAVDRRHRLADEIDALGNDR